MSDVQATSVDPAERFLHRMTPIQRVHSILHRYPALSPAVVLILAALSPWRGQQPVLSPGEPVAGGPAGRRRRRVWPSARR